MMLSVEHQQNLSKEKMTNVSMKEKNYKQLCTVDSNLKLTKQRWFSLPQTLMTQRSWVR